jgi:hypothetical protein
MKIESKVEVHGQFVKTGAFFEVIMPNSFKMKLPDTIIEGNLDDHLSEYSKELYK